MRGFRWRFAQDYNVKLPDEYDQIVRLTLSREDDADRLGSSRTLSRSTP